MMKSSFSAGRVLCLGFFDGVHLGHQALLRQGRLQADELGLSCAAVTFDRHPQALLSGAPPLLNTLEDRRALLQAPGGMDEVLILPFTPALRDLPWDRFVREILVGRFHARALVAGHDHRFGAGGQGTPERLRGLCRELGLGCTIVPQVTQDGQAVSSTAIRAALEQGRFDRALKQLGHAHRFTGTVEHGRQLGRTLGFPTVNLHWPDALILPRFGVYGGRAFARGRWYPAMTNIGVKPTVSGERPGAESYLLGFEGDLYGSSVTLELTRFVRPEQRFDSLDALKAQIAKDLTQIGSPQS